MPVLSWVNQLLLLEPVWMWQIQPWMSDSELLFCPGSKHGEAFWFMANYPPCPFLSAHDGNQADLTRLEPESSWTGWINTVIFQACTTIRSWYRRYYAVVYHKSSNSNSRGNKQLQKFTWLFTVVKERNREPLGPAGVKNTSGQLQISAAEKARFYLLA